MVRIKDPGTAPLPTSRAEPTRLSPASRPSPATSGVTTRRPSLPDSATLARLGRPTVNHAPTTHTPAAQNPSSVFSTLVQHLSDKPASKLADALPSSSHVQSILQDVEDGTGLKTRPNAHGEAHLGRRFTADRSARSADLEHRSHGELDVGADGRADGGVKLGVAGAQVHGQAQGQVGVGGKLSERWSHPLGNVAVDADAHARASGSVRGQASLDARGLDARGKVGARAEAQAHGHAVADTVFGRAEGEVQAKAAAYADGQAQVKAGLEGLGASAQGEIGAAASVHAKGEARSAGVKLGGEEVDLRAEVKGTAEVAAKAEGDAKADLRIEKGRPHAGFDVGGRAFAGARAEGEVAIGIGEIAKVKARGGVWAGAGAEGRARVHFDGKKLKVGLRAGAAVKAGAGGGATVEVDVEKAANAGIGAAVKAITAPVRYALDPSALPKDAAQAVTMGLGMGQQLASLPGQLLQGATSALDTPVRLAAA